MFRFWKWIPQDLNLIIVNVEPESNEHDRILELIEGFNSVVHIENVWIQYNKDEQPN